MLTVEIVVYDILSIDIESLTLDLTKMFRCTGSFCKMCCQTRSLQLYKNQRKLMPNICYTLATVNRYNWSAVKKKSENRLDYYKCFSVSSVNHFPLPPIMAIVLRPVAKFFAMMVGIRIRRWWSKLSEKEKKQFWFKVHKFRKQITAVVVGFISLIVLYCAAHTEIDPITGNRRFILFTQQQMVELANSIANELLSENKSAVFPTSHPYYKRAQSIAMQIINANKPYDRIKNRKWFIIVVNDQRINAMVLPNGLIIVFSGLLNIANDEQVGVVLSHEIAHCLLDHHAVRLSREHLLEMLWLIPVTIMWAVFPIPEAILSYLLGHYLKDITMLLPYERDQEIEADKYGLMLAANTCIDVRQAPIFWRKMEKLDTNDKSIWWLSTHPSHSKRVEYIENLLPYALQLRQQNGCPSLDRSYWFQF